MFLWKDYNMWHPFATSTPLKVFPDNRQCINIPSKKLIKPADAVNALLDGNFKASESFKTEKEQKCLKTNKIKKDKSNFFDISSSSTSSSSSSIFEDNNVCKKIPVLKIDVQPKSTSKTKSKNCKILLEGKKNNRIKKEVKNILSKSECSKKCFSKLKRSDVSVFKLQKKSTSDFDSEDQSPINEFKVLHQNLNKLNLTNAKLKTPKIRANINLTSTKKNKENVKIQESNVDILKKSYSKKLNSISAAKQIKSDLKSKNPNLILQINNKSTKSPSANELMGKEFSKEVKTDFEKSKISQLKNSPKRFSSKLKINCTNSSDLPRKVNKKKKVEKLKEKKRVIGIKKILKNASPSHVGEEKKNLSHQLFSDIIEQELINSLDLTTIDLDLNEQMFESNNSSQSDQIKFPKADKLKSNKNFDLMDKKHLKQKYSSKTSLFDKDVKAHGKTCEKMKDPEVILGNKICEQLDSKKKFNENQTIEAHEAYCASENYTILELKKCSLHKEGADKKFDVVTEINENDKIFKVPPTKILKTNIKSSKTKKRIESHQRKNGKMLENDVVNNEVTKPKDPKSVDTSGVESNAQDSTNHDDLECFKSFKLLQFMENKSNQTRVEYLTSECWSLKNFKFGVFKVNINSQVSSCTPFFNSYFGGILFKGNLKMKIGTKELILEEGDLAFVPPLTDWLAVNMSEREAIFYYWCGRFKT